MTQRRALEILRDYWGSGESVTLPVANEIEGACKGDESMLRTVARVSGWSDHILPRLPPYSNKAVRALASFSLARLDLIEAREPWTKPVETRLL